MKAMYRRCTGLDVHQKEIVACRRIGAGRKVDVEVRRFAATTQGLLALADWLEEGKVTHVAMEATGVYWKPVWHILHGRFTLILANAAHIKGVPGRKSDVNDATWIAELLAHGLIRSSFVPPQPARGLAAALTGRIRDHHRFLIGQHLKTIEQIEATIVEFDARIEAALGPFGNAVERLAEIPGLSQTSAEIVIAGIGVDMSQFPSADHLVSWAGLCPRLDESAGKRRSKRIRKGAPWLKPVLVQPALSAGRTKNSSFRTRYQSLKSNAGPKKAAVAVAATRHLSYAQRRHLLSGPWTRLSPPPKHGPHSEQTRQPHPRPRLRSGP